MSVNQHPAGFPVSSSACGVFRALVVLLSCLVISDVKADQALSSPEGSFSLNGSNKHAVSEFSKLLSGFEQKFYEVTGYAPGDAPAVVLVLHDSGELARVPLGNPLLRVDALEGGQLRIQVDLPQESGDCSKTTSRAMTDAVLAQALLIRQYYNGRSPDAGSHIVEFPAWLLHGMGQLCDSEIPTSKVPSSYLRGATPPTVADLMVQKEPDGSNTLLLQVYDTMSADLVSAGLKGAQGSASLRDWIGTFDPSSPVHVFSSWPPGWPMQSVERAWLLLMAGMSGQDPGVVSILSVEESLARYDEILSELTTKGHSFSALKKEKGADFTLQQLSTRFVALRLQANPLAYPLLDQTLQLCAQFKRLSEKKIAVQEQHLKELRDDVQKKHRAIESYLDWFEATRVPVRSGIFDNLLRTPEPPVQKGPVGKYLDTIEQRGW
jgi:hypothetical protein